ncbi:MAG: GtrA family protein [Bacteroidales bacterium]|nr:GtrA family protein [Bacteroidales bacterium]
MLKRLYQKFRNLILYGIFGSISAGLDFGIYTLLVQVAGIQYLVANCISVLAGITTSFLLNRNFNFKIKDKTPQRFSIFLVVGLCGLLLSNLILYLCIDQFHMHKIVSKILSIVLVVFFQFVLNKYVTFKPTKTHE